MALIRLLKKSREKESSFCFNNQEILLKNIIEGEKKISADVFEKQNQSPRKDFLNCSERGFFNGVFSVILKISRRYSHSRFSLIYFYQSHCITLRPFFPFYFFFLTRKNEKRDSFPI